MVLVLPQDPAATQRVHMDPTSYNRRGLCCLSTSAPCRDPCPGSPPSPGLPIALIFWQSHFLPCTVCGFIGQPTPTLSIPHPMINPRAGRAAFGVKSETLWDAHWGIILCVVYPAERLRPSLPCPAPWGRHSDLAKGLWGDSGVL